jgi:hypothetical protein
MRSRQDWRAVATDGGRDTLFLAPCRVFVSLRRPGTTVTPRRHAGPVENQLQLPLVGEWAVRRTRPSTDGDWRIDEPTRRVGRRGLAAARAALARTSAPEEARATAA